jgi:hypothetical protein
LNTTLAANVQTIANQTHVLNPAPVPSGVEFSEAVERARKLRKGRRKKVAIQPELKRR